MNEWREKELNQQLEFAKKLGYYLKGNVDAVRYCLDVLFIGHLWDDLVDRDKIRTPEEVNDAFRVMMGDIPTNPFYQANIAQLSGLTMSAILQWKDANKLEHGTPDDKLTSFICRNAMLSIIHYCLFLCGGLEWAEEKGPEFLRMVCEGVHAKYLEFLQEE